MRRACSHVSVALCWDPRERVLVGVIVGGVVVECPQQLAMLRVRPPAAQRRW